MKNKKILFISILLFASTTCFAMYKSITRTGLLCKHAQFVNQYTKEMIIAIKQDTQQLEQKTQRLDVLLKEFHELRTKEKEDFKGLSTVGLLQQIKEVINYKSTSEQEKRRLERIKLEIKIEFIERQIELLESKSEFEVIAEDFCSIL